MNALDLRHFSYEELGDKLDEFGGKLAVGE